VGISANFIAWLKRCMPGSTRRSPEGPSLLFLQHELDNAPVANESTRPPDSETISLRSITLSEIYIGASAPSFAHNLGRFKNAKSTTSPSAHIKNCIAARKIAIGHFVVVKPNDAQRPSRTVLGANLPPGISKVHCTYFVFGPSLVALIATFEVHGDLQGVITKELLRDVAPEIQSNDDGSLRVLTVLDKKRSAVETATRSFTAFCQSWLSDQLPGSFGTIEPKQIPSTLGVTFEELDFSSTTFPDYARAIGIEQVSHAVRFDAHPYVTVRRPIGDEVPYRRLLAFNENDARSDGWITDFELSSIAIHMLDGVTSLISALLCSYDQFERRLQKIRLTYNTFEISRKPKVKRMLNLRAGLLMISRDIACFKADLLIDLSTSSFLWDGYQSITQVPLRPGFAASTSVPITAWFSALQSRQEISHFEQEELINDLHEFSETASDITNHYLNASLAWYTLALLVLTVVAVIFGFLGLSENQHNAPIINQTTTTTTTTTRPSP